MRAALGHFAFVFIHPYMDDNGRIGRFVVNAMLAFGGYLRTVIEFGKREQSMAALAAASSGGDTAPFTRFIAASMRKTARL